LTNIQYPTNDSFARLISFFPSVTTLRAADLARKSGVDYSLIKTWEEWPEAGEERGQSL
jgi:hypothetical protein